MPKLVTAGQQVMFMPIISRQDNALASAAAYAKIADDIEDKIHQYRVHQVTVASTTVSTLPRQRTCSALLGFNKRAAALF